MYLPKNVVSFVNKSVWVDYVLLFILSIIPVLGTGTIGVMNPIDIEFSFYPLDEFAKYSYIWFEYQNGYIYIPPHVANLPILGISSFLSVSGFPLWLINRLWFIIPVFLLGCSAYYFANSVVNVNKRYVAIGASLLFILNYYTVMTISMGGIRELISMAFSVFSLSFYVQGIWKKDNKYLVLLCISSVFAVGIISYIIIAIVLAALFSIAHLLVTRKWKQNVKFILYSVIICSFSNLWWILPYLSSFSEQHYLGNPSEWVRSIASFNTLLRTITLKNSIPALPVNEIQFTAIAYVTGLLFTLIAFASLLFRKYRKVAICASLAVLVLLVFALGGSPPFGFINLWFFGTVPFFFMFKNPTRFTAYLALFYALLTSIVFVELIQAAKSRFRKPFLRRATASIIIFSFLMLGYVNSQPLLSGNMGGALKPFVLPQSYTDLHNYLNTQNKDEYMLVLPMPSWFSEFTWHDDMNHIVNPIRSISPVPLIYDEFNEVNLNELQKELAHQLYGNERRSYYEDRLTNLLRLLNVRYILLQNDQARPITGMAPGTNPIILEQIKNNLDHYSHVHISRTFGDLDLYEVDDKIFLPQVHASLNPVLVSGESVDMLGVISNNLTSGSVLFSLNQLSPSQIQFIESNNNTTTVVDMPIDVSVNNGWANPFSWAYLGNGEYTARFYDGWKIVVRTNCIGETDTLSFPSMDACPYIFPSYSSDGWNTYNSTLVYIKTGNEPLIIKTIYEEGRPVNITDIIVWWETGWMGMDTKPKAYPIILPPTQKAIIEISNTQITEKVTLNSLNVSNLSKPNKDTPLITFQKINLTKYAVNLNTSTPFFLVLSESYDANWGAYVNGKQVPNEYHFIANGFANGWYINKTGTYTVTIEFWPQKLFYAGSTISVTTLILCALYVSKDKIKIIYQKHIKSKQRDKEKT